MGRAAPKTACCKNKIDVLHKGGVRIKGLDRSHFVQRIRPEKQLEIKRIMIIAQM